MTARRRDVGGTANRWLLIEQIRGRDLSAVGRTSRSARSAALRPRTAEAEQVVRSVCPYCAVASATASAGAAAAVATPREHAGPARRAMLLGVVGSQVAETVMERRLGRVAEAYSSGTAGRYRQAARILDAAGSALSLSHGLRRRRLGAALVLAGAVATRFSVFKAGFQAAEDPRYLLATRPWPTGGAGA